MTRLTRQLQTDRPAKARRQRQQTPAVPTKPKNAPRQPSVRELSERVKSLEEKIALLERERAVTGMVKPPDTPKTKRLPCPRQVYEAAVELFNGSTDAAWDFIYFPARGLGGKSPIEVAQTDEGIQEVMDHIGRIAYGTLA